jgi:hypothetical protein
VTARGEEPERVLALDAGADDYLVKPFGLAELLARIRAVLRRVHPGGGMLRHGPLVMDVRARKVTMDGREVALTPKEFDILECLAAAPGQVVSRQEILDSAWDASPEASRTGSAGPASRCPNGICCFQVIPRPVPVGAARPGCEGATGGAATAAGAGRGEPAGEG